MDDVRFRTLIQDGLLASQQRQSERALDLFSQAQTEDPTSGLPSFLMGSELAACGRLEQAEAALAAAVLLAPAFLLARYQLGLLQFSADRPAAALVTWQPLQDLPDQEPLGHFVRGFSLLARQSYAQALEHFQAGLDRCGAHEPVADDIRQVIDAVRNMPAPADSRLPGTVH